MLINLNDLHKRDREPTDGEIEDISEDLPEISSPAKYEDLFSVDVATEIRNVNEKQGLYAANLDRWTFRMN